MTENQEIDFAKLKWQCRRGMLELDLILNEFLGKHLSKMDSPLRLKFVSLLELDDPTLYSWLLGYETIDPNFVSIIKVIREATACGKHA